MDPQDCTIKLGGEDRKVEFVRRGHRKLRKGWMGVCLREEKRILVRRDLCDKSVIDTLIHEMRHAQHPVLFEAEESIDETSTELAEGLIRSGIIK